MLTVATDYFGLVQDNRLKVVIDDGIKFLKKSVKNGNEYVRSVPCDVKVTQGMNEYPPDWLFAWLKLGFYFE